MWLALDNGALVERDKYQSGKNLPLLYLPLTSPTFPEVTKLAKAPHLPSLFILKTLLCFLIESKLNPGFSLL